ncbi:MAG: ATP-dependent transcriptional regulator, partial [Albidovulum sp.]
MRRVLTVCLAALLLSACGAPPPAARNAAVPDAPDLPPMRRFGATVPEPARRSNAEMAQDFMDLSFNLESGRT